ncbi:MAG TPA: cytochrome c-type biogenesis protein CcmH [Paracoccaceae bacterium]|nr:cytochrome c-type biogenesis protein CcmH [Paracoccaceae bacterium]
MKGRALRAALLGAVLALGLPPAPAPAVQPDEVLDDPALEARARALSRDLRCLVCRSESIDDSNAPLARDLRLILRERLVEGDSDEAAVAYLVDRFGEYVLLRPRAGGANLALWLAGPVMLLAGGGLALAYLRRRRSAPDPGRPLDPEERARLEAILHDQGT